MSSKENKKVHAIHFDATLKGWGGANYDGHVNQTELLRYLDSFKHLNPGDNVDSTQFLKKNYYINENTGEKKYNVKISSDCLKRVIFKDLNDGQIPYIVHHPELLNHYIASPVSILRGYMLADSSDTYHKKGGIGIKDATIVSDENGYKPLSSLELHSKANVDKGRTGSDDKKGNNLFKKETIGDAVFKFSGNIRYEDLEFISGDPSKGRIMFNPDHFEDYYAPNFNEWMEFNNETGYYKKPYDNNKDTEWGFSFTDEQLCELTKIFLKQIFKFELSRKNAYYCFDNIKIKIVRDPVLESPHNEDGWRRLTIDDNGDIRFADNNELAIDGLTFNRQFEMVEAETAIDRKQRIEDVIKEQEKSGRNTNGGNNNNNGNEENQNGQ